ncbi:MAG: DUF6371 domain-containing protein [Phaeodactylibacter xiamenensis]|uniref:DUF6371 domain-containing protein n=1 Tax=Phaeodactylibacter xiamenensis TaxID=1524460 RepID=UPI000697FAB3|nr:DUF6371 domain-containing protein [Phaeodactylibacter xiamenensis]MCR9054269.1 DUF6371 domain-containing protein [bacterium]
MTTAQHQFILEPYKGSRTRHRCPGCGKPREFTRYIDTQTGQHVAAHVGKCNRENKCGYHYTPRQYFLDNPTEEARAWLQSDQHLKTYTPPPPPPVDYIPPRYLERTRQQLEHNNFYRFLVKLFGEAEAARLADLYKLGTSKKFKNHDGYAALFWMIDKGGNICRAKAMAYNPETGKRIKAPVNAVKVWGKNGYYNCPKDRNPVADISKQILGKDNANTKACFFGEHLLSAAPSAPVAIVESEKTAMIMASIKPDQVWISTGAKSGAKWKTDPTVYHALEGRKVILYPDLNAIEDWEEAARNIAHVCAQVSVFRELEQYATPEQIQEGDDIADFYIPALLERRSRAAQADQEAQEGFTLPPGWQWETFHFKHGTHRQLMDSDGLPASWNLAPQTDQEKQAVAIALGQLDYFLTH